MIERLEHRTDLSITGFETTKFWRATIAKILYSFHGDVWKLVALPDNFMSVLRIMIDDQRTQIHCRNMAEFLDLK